MKVNSVNNYASKRQELNAPLFKGKALDPEIVSHLNKNSKRLTRFLNYVGNNQGEALNIIVTAVGTAIVCPLFIAFNPLSKEDKKTKEYSAWRQPISAVIAVVTQLTVTKWFNNWIAKAASTVGKDGKSQFSRADLTAQPHERYLKRIIALEHPEFDKKQIEAEVKRRQLVAEKTEIDKLRLSMKDKPIEYKDLICQDYIEKAEKQFFDEFKTQNKEEIENKFGKKIDEIWSTKLKKHLEKMLDDKAKTLGKNREELLNETAEKLVERDVTAETVVKKTIRFLKGKGINIDNAIDNCKEENIEKLIKQQGLEKKFPDGINAKEIAENITEKLKKMKEYECEQQLKDFTSVKDIGNSFEDILQNVKIKKLVRSRVSDAKRVFKTKNTQLGLVVTLATLPFTCGVLNWSYPRIMEKIMPEMAAKKKKVSETLDNINSKIEEAIDQLNLDELKDKIDIDELKEKLKFEIEKGGND